MKLFIRSLWGAGLAIAISACTGKLIDPVTPSSSELPVSEVSFNYQSTRDIDLTVRISNAASPTERFRINVYNGTPSSQNFIAAGMATTGQPLKLSLRTPAPLNYLYVQKMNAYGGIEILKLPVSDAMLCDFGVTRSSARVTTVSPDCSNGVTYTYTGYSGWLTVNAGEVVALSGSFNGSLNMNGGSVRICGNATIENVNMNNSGCTLYILAGASKVTIRNLNMNAPTTKLFNYSPDLILQGNASLGGTVENNGKMTVQGDLNINNNNQAEPLVNNGTIEVGNNLNNNRSLINNKIINVAGDYQANGGSENKNMCRLTAKNFNLNNNFDNYAYVRVSASTTINGGAVLRMYNGAMLSTANLMLNGTITGLETSQSTVKVTSNTTINGGASVSGTVGICDQNGIETNNAKTIAASFFSCENYIPVSDCNTEGFGSAPASDRDKDGVPDTLDDYPDDALRAFNSYYPSASGWSSYAFEDMWPKKGDYDFNDLVVYFRTTRVLNANNKVVDLKQNLTIGAVGASFDNGFGFQLDEVTSSAVKNVSGNVLSRNLVMQNANKTEGGHTKAVIIAFDSPEPLIKRTAGPMFNTVKSSSPGTSTPLDLTITFLTPQDEEKVAQKNINPFLFINRNRGREVHLSDYQPTALADTKLLGTGDDASNPNAKRYYKTRQNFPWALEVPNRFRQPAETVNITEAFNFFSKWVTTRGAQHDDWFEEKSGYINADKVYR